MNSPKSTTLLSALALIFSGTALAIIIFLVWNPRQLSIGANTKENSVSQTPVSSPTQVVNNLRVVTWEPCSEVGDVCGSDAWEWRSSRQGERYVFRLGDPDSDGEVRYLLVRNEIRKIVKAGQLPKELTYRAFFSESDGSPINRSPEVLDSVGDSNFKIEVYLTTPLAVFDHRLPVMVKYITPVDFTPEYSIVLPKNNPTGFTGGNTEYGGYTTGDFTLRRTGMEGPCDQMEYISGGEITIYDHNDGHLGEGSEHDPDALPAGEKVTVGGFDGVRHEFTDFCQVGQRAVDVHVTVGTQVYTIGLRAAKKDFIRLVPAFDAFLKQITFKKR